MKYLIQLVIKFYWILIPKSLRRKCLFPESCSNYVYRIAKEDGGFKAIKAFVGRWKTCRAGNIVYALPDGVEVIIKNK